MKHPTIAYNPARRRLLRALAGAAALPLAHGAHAVQPALPATLRIAAVARNAANGSTHFSGSSALIADDRWLETELGKLGVKLEWLPVTSNAVAAQVNEAFAKKAIDFAAYGDLPSIIANASGLQTQLVVPGGSLNNTYLVVPANSTAQSIRDLKGKRIALHRGRPWEYPFSRLLEANGMALTDVKILNLNPQAGAAAVSTGSADAFFTLSDAYLLEDKKTAKIIWSSKQPPQDWKMRAELWADRHFLRAYPQLAQLVATAYVRAHQRAGTAAGREEYIRAEALGGQLESVLRRELDGDRLSWKDRWSPLFTPALRAHYASEIDYARHAGLINKAVELDALFAPQFVTQALAQLNLQNYWNT